MRVQNGGRPMKTMKAIVKTAPYQGALEIQDVPMPQIGKNEVLVRIKKTAICGTDLHIHNWDSWAQRTINTPMVIGHEFVGEIAQVGENVGGLEIGQLVSGEGHLVCGKCRQCITGLQHLCRQTCGIGVNIQGVFAQYAAIPAGNIWVCDPSIPEDILSVMDPLGNAVHTALTFDVLGEDVLITGAGPIGLMAVPIVKRAGARSVTITDINPARLAMAKSMGADEIVNVRNEKVSDVFERNKMVEGFDVGLEMSGAPSALADMVDNMANGGKIAVLGIFPSPPEIDWNKVIFNSLTLHGIYGRHMYDTWYKMTALLQTGLAEEIAPIISHTIDYVDFQKGIDLMSRGEACKVVLNWS